MSIFQVWLGKVTVTLRVGQNNSPPPTIRDVSMWEIVAFRNLSMGHDSIHIGVFWTYFMSPYPKKVMIHSPNWIFLMGHSKSERDIVGMSPTQLDFFRIQLPCCFRAPTYNSCQDTPNRHCSFECSQHYNPLQKIIICLTTNHLMSLK